MAITGIKGDGEKGGEQENGVQMETLISHDWLAEQTPWAEWSNFAPVSYGLFGEKNVN